MPEHVVTIAAAVQIGRRADGQFQAIRVSAPKFFDLLFWLNREDGSTHELRPYRVGMFKRREGECHADQ